MPNPTLKSVIFWQWANQSLNGERVSLLPDHLQKLSSSPVRSLRQLRQRKQEYPDEQWRDRLYVVSSLTFCFRTRTNVH